MTVNVLKALKKFDIVDENAVLCRRAVVSEIWRYYFETGAQGGKRLQYWKEVGTDSLTQLVCETLKKKMFCGFPELWLCACKKYE